MGATLQVEANDASADFCKFVCLWLSPLFEGRAVRCRTRGRVAVGGAPSEHSAHFLVGVGTAVAEPPPVPPVALQPVVAGAVAALRAGTTTEVCSPCALGAAACERASTAVAAVPPRLKRHAVGCASI